MLQSVLHILNSKKILLATSSPRRRELVQMIGLNVIVYPSMFEEDLDPKSFETLEDFVVETAIQKVIEVDKRLEIENTLRDIIIGADTMVVLEDKIFGKPCDNDKAFEMLSQLNGKKHTVYTGVAVKAGSKTVKFCEKTDVYFGQLSEDQIRAYVETGDSLDKAGGYGIQGIGGTMIKKIDGDYYTVMGLPLYRLSSVLCEIYGNPIL